MPSSKMKITEEYAGLVARDVFFWAWPLVNVYNRRIANDQVSDFIYAGPVPLAPVNRLAMLTNYITPEERLVACPNQDVVYGAGSVALDRSAVVIQVPDFGDRFWVYQIVDLRTDSFANLGKMYGTTRGFYMLVGPKWSGEVPKGITQVFRASTNTGYIIPRVFQDDSSEDKRAIQATLSQIMMYPVAELRETGRCTTRSTFPRHRRLHRAAKRKRNGCRRSSSSTCSRPCSLTHHLWLAKRPATNRFAHYSMLRVIRKSKR